MESLLSSALTVPSILGGTALVVALTWLFRLLFNSDSERLPLPPGPRGIPIFGSLFEAPEGNSPWQTYKQWSDKYGPIMSIKNGSSISIVITSYDIVSNLLEKNNSVFSSRPIPVVIDRISLGMTTSFLPDGEKWRTHRHLRTMVLSPNMAKRYRGLQDLESKQLLHELLTDNQFSVCLRRSAVSLFLAFAYGERLPKETPEIIELEDTVAHIGQVSESTFRGTGMLAEFFPFLKYLPGNGAWKKEADRISAKLSELYVKRFRAGLNTASWNWTKQYALQKGAEGMSELERAYCIGSIYEASLTPYELVRIVILAAILHPKEAKKLQQQVDEVVGRDRLPDWEDQDSLPLVSAFFREAMRWRPIPKNATIVVNQWAMDRDPNVYEDPLAFRPQRWIENPDLPHMMYGFGMRGCPGRHVGKDYMFINVARLFWAFNMENAYKDGKKVEFDVDALMNSRGTVSFFNQVPDFEASFNPRDPKARSIIEKEWENVEKDEGKILAQSFPAGVGA
ncbi:cytochrome P450 [Penicillium verrucosum]|uniref:cytochrome P450 n=1 Tax=Penicillium verrucosum TaxID=60171 RepID=UPI002544DC9E|nr:cytochrome P450 [Penicillium verrucosum]KAJ5923142.1 cytochrome P450 [Penicillium verrucosum]